MDSKQQRIGVIGTGAIGGFYGLMLAHAGHDVHFLLRSEFEAVNRAGLSLNSAVHGFRRLAPVQAHHSAQDMPPCDWLLVGAKTTGNDELAPLIRAAAALGSQGSAAAERSGRGGAAAAAAAGKPASAGRPLLHLCASRRTGRDRAPGLRRSESRLSFRTGRRAPPARDRRGGCRAVPRVRAGVHGDARPGAGALAEAGLEHPYNGLSVLLKSSTAPLMANADSRSLIEAIMEEVIGAAGACGFILPEGYADQLLAATERMPDYRPSMYHDFAHGRPLELAAIYAAPWPALLLRATGCPGSRRCTRRCASSKRNRAEGPSAATSRRRARREKRDLPQRAGKSPKQQGTLGEWMLAANLLMRPAAQAVEEAA